MRSCYPCLKVEMAPTGLRIKPQTLSRAFRMLYSLISVYTSNLISYRSFPCSLCQSYRPHCSSSCSQSSLLPQRFYSCHSSAWKLLPLDPYRASPFHHSGYLIKCRLPKRPSLTTLPERAPRPHPGTDPSSCLIFFLALVAI